MAIETNKNGIFNVCTNEKITINGLVNVFNSILHKDIQPIYAKKRDGDIQNSYMSYEKISKEMSWSPEYSLKQGLKDMIK